MATPPDSQTRVTLLERLARSGARDQVAWEEFVEHYGRKIYRWCRQWQVQEADAQDICQTVLLGLARRLQEFSYDPERSFRAWLKTVTRHAWSDFVEARQRPGRGSGADDVVEILMSVEAREELVKQLEEQFDHELLEKAMQIVRLEVAPHNWKAFYLTAVEGLEVADVAQQLQMKVARVYAARSNIQQRLRSACQKLEGAGGDV
jgi:RNA polymerase sigma-70 factor (ECF subfamily)